MTATAMLYATSAAGSGLRGQPSYWHDAEAATGAPDGSWATNDNHWSPGYQRLVLGGYNPQAAILAGTGGAVPYSIDYLHVGVTFQLDAASNYDSIDVLLLDSGGQPIATQRLYLWDATTGVTVVGWVNFTGHNGYDDQQKLAWDELAGCQVAIELTRSGAAGTDTFRVDAVGMFAAYTLDAPTEPTPPPAPIQVQPPGGGVSLRVYDRENNRLAILPWMTLTRAVVRNDVGALNTEVPKALIPAGVLDGERYLRVAVNGVEMPEWYVLDDDGDDDADIGGTMRPVAIGGAGTAEILDWGVVYSWQYELDPSGVTDLVQLDPFQDFAGKTPGFIMAALIDQAKARGCFPHLTYSFTADVDSAGVGWPTTYSRKYDIGTSLLKVLTTMSDDGWVDWKMTGFTLDLYAADTALAVDTDVVLRLGKGVTQAPRKRTRKTTRSVLLSNGDQGATVEVADAAAEATWGRREGYEGRSGVTDLGTLTAATQVSLARQTDASESFTLELDPYSLPEETPALPRPGGYIRYDRRRLSPTELEPLRVQSIAYDYGDPPKVSVELLDLWVDADVKRGRQIDAILNGSSANERVPVPPDAPDSLAPGPVLGLALESTAYVAPDGTLGAQMTATWMQVTQNADGSAIGDLAGYELEYRQLDAMPGTETISLNALTLYRWSPVIPGVAIDVRIRAVDRFGNGGDWSPWVSIVAGDDVTPPPVPSAPIVENWLGLLKNTWDGAFADGSPRPADLDRVEVHLSTIGPDFTPDLRPIEDGGTLAGSVFAPGPVFRDTPYGQTQWVRLVAVDTTGNRSDPSAAASGATGQVVSADVFDGAIGTAKLADAAIISAKIADLAVNDAKIGSMSVGKLVAGTLTAAVIMGGRIATADTGPRIELNSLGIYRWATADDGTLKQYVAIDDQGALLVGKYRTGFAGERRIEMGAAGSTGRIDFFAPDGSNAFMQAWTENQTSKVEAIQFGVLPRAWNGVDVDTLWSRINYNVSSGGEYATYKSGTHEFTYDTAAPNSNGKFMVWDSSGRGQNGHERFEIIGYGPGLLSLVPGTTEIGTTLRVMSGNGLGLAIRSVSPAGGPQRMELLQWDASSFQRWWASGYDVQSDARVKTGIRRLPKGTSLLAELRATPPKEYRRKDRARLVRRERTEDGGECAVVETIEAPTEIGLLAQDAPERIRSAAASDGTLGVDLYQMGVHTWGAVGELAELVDELRAEVAALRKGDNT